MPDEAEYQPHNSIFQTRLLPDQISSVSLSGGRTISHNFYLGPNNTVPFVRLESPVANKEITWGEIVTLQPGSNVNIRNVSYMPGDLQIQSGNVPVGFPPRVTVPIKCIISFDGSYGTTLVPEFKCDARCARRAWLAISAYSFLQLASDGVSPMRTWIADLTVTGTARQHSHTAQFPSVKSAYRINKRMTNLPDDIALIPLGINDGGNAMRLADEISVELFYYPSRGTVSAPAGEAPGAILDAAYVLEY